MSETAEIFKMLCAYRMLEVEYGAVTKNIQK